MHRREFFKLSGSLLAKLSLTPYGLAPALAQTVSGNKILWINVQANGAWDQALFCDPKPHLRGDRLGDSTLYPNAKEIRQQGNIPYLGFADFGAASELGFVGKNHQALTVINGIDTETNNHDVGLRYASSGSVNDGFPCLSAQLAAGLGPKAALAFVDGGGSYGESAGLVVPSRILGENVGQFNPVFNYNHNSNNYHDFVDSMIKDKVEAAHQQRLQRLAQKATHSSEVSALNALLGARKGQQELQKILIPAAKNLPSASPLLGYLLRLIDFVFNAHKQGATFGFNLAFGGFDTHDDNESGQKTALRRLLAHVDYIMELAEDVQGGGANKVPVVVTVTSDFGRTPHYTGSGTDHWPIASMLILQSSLVRGQLGIPSNCVIGATDDDLKAKTINANTLAVDPQGLRVTPGHWIRVLRRAAGIAASPTLAAFPIQVAADLKLGGPST